MANIGFPAASAAVRPQKKPIRVLSGMPGSPFNMKSGALPASAQRRNATGVSGAPDL